MEVSVVKLSFEDLKLNQSDATKLRGYIGRKYEKIDILHNHSGKEFIYRYPEVQYKVIKTSPIIIGINRGVEIVKEIGFNEESIIIEGKNLHTFRKSISENVEEFGISNDYVNYKFITPWICLNQNNITKYKNASLIEKEEILKKILIGNIISMSKGFSYDVNERLHCWCNLKEKEVKLKGIPHIAFEGEFKVNFHIPNYLGLGKSVSRGFGTILKY